MKILTYNVNGLKPFYNKGLLYKLFVDFPEVDIYCFQEVKAFAEDTNNIMKKFIKEFCKENETLLYFHTPNPYIKNYAGVLTVVKIKDTNKDFKKLYIGGSDELINTSEISLIGKSEYWLGRSGYLKTPNFLLYNLYVPNSGNKDDLRKAFDISLENKYTSINTEIPIILVGDFNVCSTELDYWGDYEKAKDSCPGLKEYEIKDFNRFLVNTKFIDIFRYFNIDKRAYTYYSIRAKNPIEENKGWRLDYALIDIEHIKYIKDIKIMSGYNGADHSPIILEI